MMLLALLVFFMLLVLLVVLLKGAISIIAVLSCVGICNVLTHWVFSVLRAISPAVNPLQRIRTVP